jgi:DNA polymerase
MVIGEGPGKGEDERRERDGTGHPFIGDSGLELDELYLPLMGLKREQVFVTNVIRCLPRDKKGTDNQELAQCCSDYFLWSEIRRVKPRVVITLGSKSGHVFDPLLNLEMDHGLARKITLNDLPVIWVPLYHPAAGMRQPEMMQALLDDCSSLRYQMVYLTQGTLHPTVDPHPNPDYKECLDEWDVRQYLEQTPRHSLMGIDTEYDDRKHLGKDAICLSFSVRPGTGRVIQPKSTAAMNAFRSWVASHNPLALFHHWMADVGVLRDMGLEFPRFDDTMLLAYHLGNQPQSLKILAHRLAHMEMQEFSDLVDPYWHAHVVDWAMAGSVVLKPPPPPKVPHVKGTKRVKAVPPPKTGFERMGTNLARLASDIIDGKDVKIMDRYRGWEDVDRIVPLVGPIPFRSLRMAPWPKAVWYACRDADATLRCYPLLRHKSWHILREQGR